MEFKTTKCDDAGLELGENESGVFTGYAAIFNIPDQDGDIILPGAFEEALKSEKKPNMFFNHAYKDIPIGKWLHLKQDEKGLLVKGELTPGNPTADTLKAAIEHGTVRGLSVNFLFNRKDCQSNGRGDTLRCIKRLPEISLCTSPAQEQAFISRFKSADEKDLSELIHWLIQQPQFNELIAKKVKCQIEQFNSQKQNESSLKSLHQKILSLSQIKI